MNAQINLAGLVRHTQKLANSTQLTPAQIEEFEFYIELSRVLTQVLTPGFIQNLVPITLKRCSIEKAQELAKPLGLHVAEGSSGTIYLGWSKGLAVD